jgi:hypothetical protein
MLPEVYGQAKAILAGNIIVPRINLFLREYFMRFRRSISMPDAEQAWRGARPQSMIAW